MRMTMGRRAYPSDLTDAQWEMLASLIPEPSPQGRPPILWRREIESAHPLRAQKRLPVAAPSS